MNDVAKCVDEVLRSRRTTRAFKADPLSKEQVAEILEVAATAPSNSNTQPWRVHVVAGSALQLLSEVLVAAFRSDQVPPYAHFPDPLPSEFAARQNDFGARYYAALGIDRADTAARLRQTEKNFSFFGAPVGLIFTIDRRLTRHSWLDLGLFVQNVMIAAKARGIDTCPQVSFARFHAVIAEHLGLGPEEVTACGMSMGYGNPEAAVNQVKPPRVSCVDFARFS
jgi:nitroreductase